MANLQHVNARAHPPRLLGCRPQKEKPSEALIQGSFYQHLLCMEEKRRCSTAALGGWGCLGGKGARTLCSWRHGLVVGVAGLKRF